MAEIRQSPSGPEIEGGDVLSVFTRTGQVVAVAGDYNASQITNDSGVAGANVDNALDTLGALSLQIPNQLRWYGKVIADNVLADTGINSRNDPGTTIAGIVDPIDLLDTLSGARAEFSCARATKVTRFSMTRNPGEPGTDPTGDAAIVWTLQTWNAVTDAQADVTAATLSFTAAEYGAKSVAVDFTVTAGLYLFVRADYPTNWLQQNRGVVDYQVVDILTEFPGGG